MVRVIDMECLLPKHQEDEGHPGPEIQGSGDTFRGREQEVAAGHLDGKLLPDLCRPRCSAA